MVKMPNSGTNKLEVRLKPLGTGSFPNKSEHDGLKLRVAELMSVLQKNTCEHRLASMNCKARFWMLYNIPMHLLSAFCIVKSLVAGFVNQNYPSLAQALSVVVAILAVIQMMLFHSNKLASLDFKSKIHRIHSAKMFALLEKTKECRDEHELLTLEAAYNTIDNISVSVLCIPEKIQFAFDLLSSELKMQHDLSQKFMHKKGLSPTATDDENDQLFFQHILYFSYQELASQIANTPSSCICCCICRRDRWLLKLPDPESAVQDTLEKIRGRVEGGNAWHLFAESIVSVTEQVDQVEQMSTCSGTESTRDVEKALSKEVQSATNN